MDVIGYLAAIVMGLSLGMIGGGGSILTVPILVYLFGLAPVLATGYSLFIVGLTSAVGTISYIRRGDIDFKTGLIFAGPSFVGVYLARRYVVPSLPETIVSFGDFEITRNLLIMGTFAVLMVAASASMIRKKKPAAADAPPKTALKPGARNALIGAEGLVVGGVTGFVGAGGGFLIIPALVILAGLPMRIAVGTSLMIIAIKSLFGFLGDVKTAGAIDWVFLLVLSAIAIVGILAGSALSKHVPEQKLKTAFGWFVLIMGSTILIEQLTKM